MTEVPHGEQAKRERIARAIVRIEEVETKGLLSEGERAMFGVIRACLEDEGPTYNCAKLAMDVLAHMRAKFEIEFRKEQDRTRRKLQSIERQRNYEARVRARKDTVERLGPPKPGKPPKDE